MNTLKSALGDYMYDNYNRQSQGQFLKQTAEAKMNIKVPLKEEQIKVTKRDQVLIKQRAGSQNKTDRTGFSTRLESLQ